MVSEEERGADIPEGRGVSGGINVLIVWALQQRSIFSSGGARGTSWPQKVQLIRNPITSPWIVQTPPPSREVCPG